MKKFDSQAKLIMLPTINFFKLIKSSHEYQIMKYVLATFCHIVVPKTKME